MKRLIASVTALTAFLCTGCGADSSKNSNAENSTAATIAVSTTVVTTTTTTTKPEIRQYDKNVYNIYRYFKEKCSKVDKYIEYDKDTDPNKSYGSDTSYAQKLNFSFTDIKEEQLVHPDLGGTIEIFKSEFGASSKEKEYSANKDDIDYHVFRYKNVILRITKEEDTGTLNTLKTALQEFFKDPQDYMKDKDSAQKKETHPLGDKEYYKEQCEEISYDDIARDRNGLKGKFVKLKGQVIQNLDGEYRMNVTADDYGIYKDTIMFTYILGDDEGRILEDDIVTIWGQSAGLITYTTVMGNELTIPYIEAKYVSIDDE